MHTTADASGQQKAGVVCAPTVCTCEVDGWIVKKTVIVCVFGCMVMLLRLANKKQV
jgi:hypothetical protein